MFKEIWRSFLVGWEDWEVNESRYVLGPTVFSAEWGTWSYRKVDLRVKRTYNWRGDDGVTLGKLSRMDVWIQQSALARESNIFVLLLLPKVRWTAKGAIPRNAKEPPEFWAELWRCRFSPTFSRNTTFIIVLFYCLWNLLRRVTVESCQCI